MTTVAERTARKVAASDAGSLPALAARRKPASLTEQVYAMLRTEILTCVLEPGKEVSEAELAERAMAWRARGTDYGSGALWKYAQTVGPAYLGAVTHPGQPGETHVYADL